MEEFKRDLRTALQGICAANGWSLMPHSSPRTMGTAPGTGILGPETKGRNCRTSANGDRDQSERRRNRPAFTELGTRAIGERSTKRSRPKVLKPGQKQPLDNGKDHRGR